VSIPGPFFVDQRPGENIRKILLQILTACSTFHFPACCFKSFGLRVSIAPCGIQLDAFKHGAAYYTVIHTADGNRSGLYGKVEKKNGFGKVICQW
jgi:hypothetical protein